MVATKLSDGGAADYNGRLNRPARYRSTRETRPLSGKRESQIGGGRRKKISNAGAPFVCTFRPEITEGTITFKTPAVLAHRTTAVSLRPPFSRLHPGLDVEPRFPERLIDHQFHRPVESPNSRPRHGRIETNG